MMGQFRHRGRFCEDTPCTLGSSSMIRCCGTGSGSRRSRWAGAVRLLTCCLSSSFACLGAPEKEEGGFGLVSELVMGSS